MWKSKKGIEGLRVLYVSFEVVLGAALILFFIQFGLNAAEGTSQDVRYIANDLAMTVETAQALTADKLVITPKKSFENYKVALQKGLTVEEIGGLNKAQVDIVKQQGVVFSKYTAPEKMSIIKLEEKVLLADKEIRINELILGAGATTRIQVHQADGVVVYEAS